MERSLNSTNPKSCRACAALQLPSDIGDAHTDQNDGACCRPGISISVISHTPAVASLTLYAFRPIGSTSAAVISLFHTITTLLQSNPFVIVVSLEAFDTVRHSTLLAKMAGLELPVPVCNWIVDFFPEHAQCRVSGGPKDYRGLSWQ